MKFIELFAGIGGFRYGLEAANRTQDRGSQEVKENGDSKGHKKPESPNAQRGQPSEHSNNRRYEEQFTCVYANEFNKYAAQIYERNYAKDNKETQEKRDKRPWGDSTNTNGKPPTLRGSKPAHGCVDTRDIREVDAPEIPDHDLLTAGFPCQSFSIAGKRGGFEDTRGTLFFEIARIAKQKQPRLLLLENVKGLLSHDNGKTFGTILNTLDELGYDLQWQVLNSKNFGVPQNRERVFIIGHLRGTSRPEVFPITQSSQSHLKYSGGVISSREQWLKDGKHNSRNFSQGQRIYSKNGISQTLAGNAGGQGGKTGLYDTGDMKIRRLTPIECERLQGLPDGWTEGISDTQRYKCLGNAVTTNVVEAIGKKLSQQREKGKE